MKNHNLTEGQQWYRDYLYGDSWKSRAKEWKQAVNWRCDDCHQQKPDYQLHCHHNTYVRCPDRELASDIDILCDCCHQEEHRKGKYCKYPGCTNQVFAAAGRISDYCLTHIRYDS